MSALIIISGFFNCVEGETIKKVNPFSVANSAKISHAEKLNDSGEYAEQLRALLERLAELYLELNTYVEQFKVVKNALRAAQKDYGENPSSQNLKRLVALEKDLQKIIARIKTLRDEIDKLENILIPSARRKLSEKGHDTSDSRNEELLDTIESIKSEINQVAGQYPELDVIINDKLKYKAPVHKKRGVRSRHGTKLNN